MARPTPLVRLRGRPAGPRRPAPQLFSVAVGGQLYMPALTWAPHAARHQQSNIQCTPRRAGTALLAVYGFGVAAMWISKFADEIVGLLQFLGLLGCAPCRRGPPGCSPQLPGGLLALLTLVHAFLVGFGARSYPTSSYRPQAVLCPACAGTPTPQCWE